MQVFYQNNKMYIYLNVSYFLLHWIFNTLNIIIAYFHTSKVVYDLGNVDFLYRLFGIQGKYYNCPLLYHKGGIEGALKSVMILWCYLGTEPGTSMLVAKHHANLSIKSPSISNKENFIRMLINWEPFLIQ